MQADLSLHQHQQAVLKLTAAYALDAMGNGGPLPSQVLDQLIPGLQAHPTTLIFLAREQETFIGIATCFIGFSTFAARPLINIHDLAVLPEQRGKGVGQALLLAVEQHARANNFCKLTLETQENNLRARSVYAAAGFTQAVYVDATGGSLFYSKKL
jgi:ribosomal protein S18 acetylase RimI-like enzyme